MTDTDTSCVYSQCARPVARRGRCWAHYERLRGRTAPNAPLRRERDMRGGRRRSTTELIEDVEWLLGTDHPGSITIRLGYNAPRSLARQLRRLGRDDLANHFDYNPATGQVLPGRSLSRRSPAQGSSLRTLR